MYKAFIFKEQVLSLILYFLPENLLLIDLTLIKNEKKKQNSKPLEHLQPSGSNIQAAKVPPMNQRQVKPEEKGSTYEASMQFECSDTKFSLEGILFYFDQTINSYMNNNADFETYNAGA